MASFNSCFCPFPITTRHRNDWWACPSCLRSEVLGEFHFVLNWPHSLHSESNLSWPSKLGRWLWGSRVFELLTQKPSMKTRGGAVTQAGFWLLDATRHVHGSRVLTQWVYSACLYSKTMIMTLKCIRLWGSCSRVLGFYGIRSYLLVTITPGSILAWSGCTCQVPNYERNSFSGKA